MAAKSTKARKRVQLDREIILDAALRLAQNPTYDAVTVSSGASVGTNVDCIAIPRQARVPRTGCPPTAGILSCSY